MSAHAPERVRAELAGGRLYVEDTNQIQSLTQREREVMEAISDGLGAKEVAYRLGVSPQTVKNHVTRALQEEQRVYLSEQDWLRWVGRVAWLEERVAALEEIQDDEAIGESA